MVSFPMQQKSSHFETQQPQMGTRQRVYRLLRPFGLGTDLATTVTSVGCFMGFRNFTILMALLVFAPITHAVKMDETTHDMVIQRLQLGIDNMDKNEPERAEIQLRLADLLSDRARLKAMNEMEQNCSSCKGAQSDRLQAISLYSEALSKLGSEKQGPVILQMAHLHNLTGQSKKATDLYNDVLNARGKSYTSDVKGVAYSSIGEIEFRKGEFKTALKYLEAARHEKIKSKALVEFRIAWCQLNLGQTELAVRTMTNLLQNPKVLATQTTDGHTIDASFVQDASKDLARFLARSEVGPKELALLRRLSPEAARKGNLHTLASECDRLGKKSTALMVWEAYVQEKDVTSNEKIEVKIRIARIEYDMGKFDKAAVSFEKAMEQWRKTPCTGSTDDDSCNEMRVRARAIVTGWNKLQKDKATLGLLRVYTAYTKTFSDDVEMWHWAGVVASDLGRQKEAIALFHRAAELSKDKKELAKIFEGSLLGAIEMAEATKDNKTRENAYNYYLQMNASGAKAFEVRYQRAQLFAATNRPQEAFSEFHYLVSQPGQDHRDLKVKSADLALDSLVALKDDNSLQMRGIEYARIFPERKSEYLKISRKASMNIVAATLAAGKSKDRAQYQASLALLDKVNMEGADENERIRFYKNKIAVAQKALALESVSESANKLLIIKSLAKDDREWALAQKVWVAELQLNFSQAYKTTLDMQLPKLSKAERELRLGILAELAGQNSYRHNEEFLRLNKNMRSGNLVRVTMIRESSAPWRELDKHLKHLRQTPDVLAGISLEVFARNPDLARAESLLRTTDIGKFPAGQTLVRHLDLRDFGAFDRSIARHQLRGSSDKAMQKTLKERMDLLARSEKQAHQAIARHDWTLEILALSQLARENRRLYQDILNLPIPRALRGEDREKYEALLKSKSEPFLARAEAIDDKLSQMWGNATSLQNLQTTFMTSSSDLQKLYSQEVRHLAQFAPSGAKNRLENLLNTPYRRPSQREILNARRDLGADPFDISKAQSLRDLESQRGNSAMVVYLDERISQLKKGKDI